MAVLKASLVVFFCILFADSCSGQVIGLGKCVRPKVQPNFDANRVSIPFF